jgi:hypothetical protein
MHAVLWTCFSNAQRPPFLQACLSARQAYQGYSSSWQTLRVVKTNKLNSKLNTCY